MNWNLALQETVTGEIKPAAGAELSKAGGGPSVVILNENEKQHCISF